MQITRRINGFCKIHSKPKARFKVPYLGLVAIIRDLKHRLDQHLSAGSLVPNHIISSLGPYIGTFVNV